MVHVRQSGWNEWGKMHERKLLTTPENKENNANTETSNRYGKKEGRGVELISDYESDKRLLMGTRSVHWSGRRGDNTRLGRTTWSSHQLLIIEITRLKLNEERLLKQKYARKTRNTTTRIFWNFSVTSLYFFSFWHLRNFGSSSTF